MFVVVGCLTGYLVSARPLYRLYQAHSWTPTACEVISSQTVRGDDTARPEIIYRYEVGGRQYTADRYDFLPGSRGDRTIPVIVANHPAGKKFECYVDPDDPTRAVISREWTFWYLMGIPFFVLFSGIPGGVGIAALYRRRRDAAAQQALSGSQAHGASGGVGGSVADSRFTSAFAAAPPQAPRRPARTLARSS